jgi:hypothetical protein
MRGGELRNSVSDWLRPSGSRVDDAQSNRRTAPQTSITQRARKTEWLGWRKVLQYSATAPVGRFLARGSHQSINQTSRIRAASAGVEPPRTRCPTGVGARP